MITLLRIRNSPDLPPLQDLFESAKEEDARILLQALAILCIERGNHILLRDENSTLEPDQEPIEVSVISFRVEGPDSMALLACMGVHLTLDISYDEEIQSDCCWILIPSDLLPRNEQVAFGIQSPLVSFAELADKCGSLGLVGRVCVVSDIEQEEQSASDQD